MMIEVVMKAAQERGSAQMVAGGVLQAFLDAGLM